MTTKPRRRYNAPARRRQAEQTRLTIVNAAADTFDEHGYAGTKISDIAERADVSVESVYGVGTKGALLVQAFKLRYAGGASWNSVMESEAGLAVLEQTDPDAALDAWMEFLRTANDRAARLWRAVCAAVPTEPVVAELHADIWNYRRESFKDTVRWMIGLGLLPADTAPESIDRLAAEVSTLTSFEMYEQLVHDWGWVYQDYETWVRHLLTSLRP